jgi:hypothetical protein
MALHQFVGVKRRHRSRDVEAFELNDDDVNDCAKLESECKCMWPHTGNFLYGRFAPKAVGHQCFLAAS